MGQCCLHAWLTTPGPILLKRHARASKYEPLVEEVELIDANPNYICVKLKGSGEEKTVLLRDVAPVGGESEENRNLVAKIKLLF